jgi:FAD:protein FMN transferase
VRSNQTGRLGRARASIALMLLAGAAGGIVTAAQTAETHEYRYVMGTSVEVQAFGAGDEQRRAAIEEAFAAFAEIDRLMSNYRDDSELAMINRDAARRAVPVSDPMFAVLDAARRVSEASNGAFDATVGPLVRAWGFYDKTPHVPSAGELAAVRPLVGYRQVRLDGDLRTVRFTRPDVELDLGGIAKGFAVEVAAGVLRRRGLNGFIDAGGNQYLLGTPPGKRAWTIGIKNPEARNQVLGVVETGETSVSTSADYYNFLVAGGGRQYGHILDPRTLQPAAQSLSATVLSRDGTLGDAMSKAAFILGPTDGIALVDAFPGMAAVIAFRKPDGSIGVVTSRSLAGSYHPVPR